MPSRGIPMDRKIYYNAIIVPFILIALVLSAFSGVATSASAPEAPDLEDTGQNYILPQGWESQKNIPGSQDNSASWSEKPAWNAPGILYILVEPGIYPSIFSHVARYMNDVANDGFTPELHTEGWADEFEVKALLETGYSNGMVGAFFIGDVPFAMGEIDNDYGAYGYTSFPIDLFYMDIDGTWVDNNPANGIFDDHLTGTGDLQPEIWVGRLYASTITIAGEDEVSLIQNYLDKNHEYRMGNLTLANRALVYIDDDWEPWSVEYGNDVGLRYTDYTLINDPEETVVEDYMDRLATTSNVSMPVANETVLGPTTGDVWNFDLGYTNLVNCTLWVNESGTWWNLDPYCSVDYITGEVTMTDGWPLWDGLTVHAYLNYSVFPTGYDWVSLFAHSAWYYHMMYYNGKASSGYIANTEISDKDPIAHFFNLFCCSAGDYSDSGYDGCLSGHYIFSQTYTVGAIASTKTGSMLNFADFYWPLSQGATLGEAFLDWYILNGESGAGSQFDSRCWFYGMTIAGDPTLSTFDLVKPDPPENQRGEISGNDLILTWDPSPTPDVSHYRIYRSTDPAAFDLNTPWHNTSSDANPIACTWTDSLAGIANESYYYIIRASDNGWNEDNNTQILAKFYKSLGTGEDWDMISIPLIQTSTNIEDALSGMNWSYALWYDPVDTTDHWKTYSTSRPAGLNDLTVVDPSMGLWVQTFTSDQLTAVGSLPETTQINLRTGWNLVSYPSFTERTVADALWGTGATNVEVYDPASPYKVTEVGPTYVMRPGEGYWIKVSADTIWTVDW